MEVKKNVQKGMLRALTALLAVTVPIALCGCGKEKTSSVTTAAPTNTIPVVSESEPVVTPSLTPTPIPTPTPTPTPTPKPSPSGAERYQTNQNLPYLPFYPEEKLVAFTFDDGPDKFTEELLKILGEEDRVTFFINGYMMEPGGYGQGYEKYIKMADEAGCEIGIHTQGHVSLFHEGDNTSLDDEEIAEQLLTIEEKVLEVTGKRPWLMRPPGGGFIRGRNYGYAVIHWSVDTDDWRYKTAYWKGQMTFEEAVQGICDQNLENIRSGDIVLMHDNNEVTVEAFKRMAKALKEEGFKLVTVSEMLGIEPAEYTGYYFHSTGNYGYSGKRFMLSRDTGKISVQTYSYPFEVTSPVLEFLKKEEK